MGKIRDRCHSSLHIHFSLSKTGDIYFLFMSMNRFMKSGMDHMENVTETVRQVKQTMYKNILQYVK